MNCITWLFGSDQWVSYNHYLILWWFSSMKQGITLGWTHFFDLAWTRGFSLSWGRCWHRKALQRLILSYNDSTHHIRLSVLEYLFYCPKGRLELKKHPFFLQLKIYFSSLTWAAHRMSQWGILSYFIKNTQFRKNEKPVLLSGNISTISKKAFLISGTLTPTIFLIRIYTSPRYGPVSRDWNPISLKYHFCSSIRLQSQKNNLNLINYSSLFYMLIDLTPIFTLLYILLIIGNIVFLA